MKKSQISNKHEWRKGKFTTMLRNSSKTCMQKNNVANYWNQNCMRDIGWPKMAFGPARSIQKNKKLEDFGYFHLLF